MPATLSHIHKLYVQRMVIFNGSEVQENMKIKTNKAFWKRTRCEHLFSQPVIIFYNYAMMIRHGLRLSQLVAGY